MAAADTTNIEPIRAEHVESFHRALDAVSRERKYLSFLEAPPLDAVRAFVLDMIENNHPQFVAIADGEVAGWCDIRRQDRVTRAHCGTLGIGILPAYRDKGLGAQLMRRALDSARQGGLHRVELSVHADNARAIALYEKIGFVHEGRARDAVLIDGRYIDSLNMAIILGN
ncbi:GNAT family N-acetyltransferase [Rhizobium pusense]|uniref:Acetyltransferase n=2 Tax=Hyphomicrobiales TaxID=356 RepID=A0A9W5B009_9HYPH|nr:MULTISPECIES: GNAT family protein [Rhizobium/Agrobacterium group]MDH0911610.1 GNAT family N-acetyltransferase [Agrobacterium pusense]MDH1094831.1 GNAT family N-acetyltransferase [Agrobacterium pusense]MDH1112087.1 GNAT family N-acetyltransferase [Agrobacterium pusense]MDH2196117.1 GNAT family N-acetyltransferase [Agrobacterium pusense]MRG66384.1 GNAT family N-acetyltransferase [Agrobacterium pusense]